MMIKCRNILLVEDNPDHVFLTIEGLRRAGFMRDVMVVENGQEAIDYLYRNGKYCDVCKYPLPNLILLDINLPKRSGLEVLKIIKDDEGLKGIPTIMLTTSNNESEILKSYSYGANSYVTKPMSFKDFMSALNSLLSFWCKTSTLPTTH